MVSTLGGYQEEAKLRSWSCEDATGAPAMAICHSVEHLEDAAPQERPCLVERLIRATGQPSGRFNRDVRVAGASTESNDAACYMLSVGAGDDHGVIGGRCGHLDLHRPNRCKSGQCSIVVDVDVNIALVGNVFGADPTIAIAIGVRPHMLMPMMLVVVMDGMERKSVGASALERFAGPSARPTRYAQEQNKKGSPDTL
jgi:hypothetical protein